MNPKLTKSILLTDDSSLLDELNAFRIGFPGYLEQSAQVDTEQLLKASIVYIDIRKHYRFWRNFKKIRNPRKPPLVLILNEKNLSTESFLRMIRQGENFYMLIHPFTQEQLRSHFDFIRNNIMRPIWEVDEGTLTYQILARFNDVFDRLLSKADKKNISNELIGREVLQILTNELQFDEVYYARIRGNSVLFKKFLQEEGKSVPLEEANSIDEFLQIRNYKTPVLKNFLKKSEPLVERIFGKLSLFPAHALLIPSLTTDGEDVIWILARKDGDPITSYEFYLSHFLTKSYFMGTLLIRSLEVNLFKWDRFKSVKKDLSLLRRLFDAFHFGLIVMDQNFVVRSSNRKASEILGKPIEAMEDRPLSAIFSPDGFELIEQNLRIQQDEFRGEFEFVDENGQKKAIGFSFYPKLEMGDEQLIMLIFRDISEMKTLEEEKLRNERLTTLGVIASEIAHEIRNPLAGIRAIAETMTEEMEVNHTVLEYARRIIRQTERMEKLVRNLFVYAKPPRPTFLEFDVEEMIKELIVIFSDKLKEKNIRFTWEIHPDTRTIKADPDQIQQVLVNLIQNCIDAISSDGDITLIVRPSENPPAQAIAQLGKTWMEKHYIEMVVKDTGCGIPENIRSKLFTPFFSTKEEGMGLGLSIVYQIVKEHGGWIGFESEPGKGTEFRILLPQHG